MLETTSDSSEGEELQVTTPSLVEWTSDNKTRNTVIGSVLLIVNALTLVTIVRTPTLRSHTKLLIGSLTCTDMLMGLITLLPRLLPWHDLSHEPLCLVRYAGVCLAVYCSCMSVVSITIDRMLALSFPILYRTSVSFFKSLMVVITAWGLSAVLTAASMVGGFQKGYSCTMLLVLPSGGHQVMGYVVLSSVLAVVGLYVYIGLRLRQRFRRVRVWTSNLEASEVTGAAASSNRPSVSLTAVRSENRTTLAAVLLAVCFLMGYLPIAVYLLWVTYSGVDILEETKTQRLFILIACPLVNCILDPVAYFWRLQTWDSGPFRLCRKLVKRGGMSSSLADTAGNTRRTEAN